MLEEEDRKAIIVTVLDMLNEQIAAPIEKLFVALLFELMASSAVDYARLATRLETFWKSLPEYEQRSAGGAMYFRLLRLLQLMRDDPERFLASVLRNDEPPVRVPPDWLRGVIQGGVPDGRDPDGRKPNDPS
jgi:hypothetical protein